MICLPSSLPTAISSACFNQILMYPHYRLYSLSSAPPLRFHSIVNNSLLAHPQMYLDTCELRICNYHLWNLHSFGTSYLSAFKFTTLQVRVNLWTSSCELLLLRQQASAFGKPKFALSCALLRNNDHAWSLCTSQPSSLVTIYKFGLTAGLVVKLIYLWVLPAIKKLFWCWTSMISDY